MPRHDRQAEARPMTKDEIKALNAGTTPVTCKANNSKWLMWTRNGEYFAKYVDGAFPMGMMTPCRMNDEKFHSTFVQW